MENSVGIIAIIVPIFVACIFIFTFAMILSPKLRGKWMSRQIKAAKYMMDESEDDLKEMSTKGANISKEGIKITTRAIRDGLIKDEKYCKYCGEAIDEDSIFCKKCGREQ